METWNGLSKSRWNFNDGTARASSNIVLPNWNARDKSGETIGYDLIVQDGVGSAVLEHTGRDDQKRFYVQVWRISVVNGYTGQVKSVTIFYKDKLTKADALKIAKKYMKEHPKGE